MSVKTCVHILSSSTTANAWWRPRINFNAAHNQSLIEQLQTELGDKFEILEYAEDLDSIFSVTEAKFQYCARNSLPEVLSKNIRENPTKHIVVISVTSKDLQDEFDLSPLKNRYLKLIDKVQKYNPSRILILQDHDPILPLFTPMSEKERLQKRNVSIITLAGLSIVFFSLRSVLNKTHWVVGGIISALFGAAIGYTVGSWLFPLRKNTIPNKFLYTPIRQFAKKANIPALDVPHSFDLSKTIRENDENKPKIVAKLASFILQQGKS